MSEDGKAFQAIIDFGDLAYAPYIANVSISLAYLILLVQKEEINPLISAFLQGYERHFPLSTEEKKRIPDLICLRLATR